MGQLCTFHLRAPQRLALHVEHAPRYRELGQHRFPDGVADA
jgi:hypothetical protein